VTIGVRMVDESRSDMTQYISWEKHQQLRQQLHEAKAEAAKWEDRYWDLLSQIGGTTS
jgi:hypothetical protein